jgi:hypothetical protein
LGCSAINQVSQLTASARTHTRENRARLLIGEIVRRLTLDLNDMVVLTEMASGPYIYTPLIACLAGASQVLAVVKDSSYGRREEITARGQGLIQMWGIDDRIVVVPDPTPTLIAKADIVTNLGFVRPIDSTFVSHMKAGAVIPYMREAWEFRAEDLDLAACWKRNIPVMGTSENHNGLGIFDFCGPLAAKMLFEAGVEVKDNHIAVASQDSFGEVISTYLQACGAQVQRVRKASELDVRQHKRLDALVVACYTTDELIVGPDGWFEADLLATHHPECTVVQFVGNVDAGSLALHGLRCIPGFSVGARRMAQTLAALGPKPVIDLHAAGLKVGELMWRKMQEIGDAQLVSDILAEEMPLCQKMPSLRQQTS